MVVRCLTLHLVSVVMRRRTPRSGVEEVAPEKLSQEAFRLLRTVQSLLGVQDPLTHRLTPVSDSESSRDNTWVRSSSEQSLLRCLELKDCILIRACFHVQ